MDTDKRVILIGGYSQAGKNTFSKSFQGENDIQWTILTREGLPPLDAAFYAAPFFETAFAFSLKKTVSDRLGIDIDHVEDLKEIPLSFEQLLRQKLHWHDPSHPLHAHVPFGTHPPSFATLRDVLIDEAAFQRRHDPAFYAKACHRIITSEAPSSSTCLVTDWRYPNEHEFFINTMGPENVVTIRVVRDAYRRSSAPSEHALDSYSPDYIAVPRTVSCDVSSVVPHVGRHTTVSFNNTLYSYRK